jgi:hypothetical protein
MSLSALKTAIYNRAAGIETLTDEAEDAQGGLIALLDTDPDTDLPAVVQRNTAPVVVYPTLVFGESGGTPDNRWGEDVGGIRDVIIDFQIWADGSSGNLLSDIHDYVDQLFNERRGISPLLTLTSGRIKHMEALTDLNIIFDRDRNASYGFCRYRFILCHY